MSRPARSYRDPATRGRVPAGHTMVELMVVGVIMAILAMIVMQAASPMAASTLRLRDRNYASTELRFAVESLLADLGGTEKVKAPSGDLKLERYTEVLVALGLYSGGNDAGIVYSLDGTDLHRADDEAGTDVIVARNVQSFVATRVPSVGIRATFVTGLDDAERTVEVVWTY
ncbi:MAG: hypothetical protein DRQ55_01955 [Planctomycetota bacterium]|nr:MAG: hypothetical protein DRQ55_01955 [Planctomycetota bacterium]